ncbi:MAG TPA: GspMb/PilO family protein [Bryobacteraceae bacterium]|jgi:Tfp pilus assembly protein PilO|nr:GspMb/PilO family protein [Bryobacteraceae bacterium]
MPKSSELAPKIRLSGFSLKDPRVAMRAAIGVLLVANLAMAVVAFKPFGGSADDLRKDQASLSSQLRQLQASLEKSKQHVGKIEIARTEGDEFMSKYIMDKRSAPVAIVEELNKAATDAGVHVLPNTFSYEDIEGSDALQMISIAAPFEGNYAGLAKLVNVLEKSPRFWIIDEMSLNAPQQQNQRVATAQQNINVNLKLLAFVRQDVGAPE